MTLTNHILAGSLIAKFLPLPFAVPVAFLSHFLLDSLPHFGITKDHAHPANQRLDRAVIAIDIITACTLGFWLVSNGHLQWLLVGIVAFSPDFIWVYRYVFQEKFGTLQPKPGGKFIQFHMGIQKYEFKLGWIVEILLGIVFVSLVVN